MMPILTSVFEGEKFAKFGKRVVGMLIALRSSRNSEKSSKMLEFS